MSAKPTSRWAVAHVATGAEDDARKRWGTLCEVYMPVITVTIRPWRTRRPANVDRPLLPGYLFVNAETVIDPKPIYDDSSLLHFVDSDGPVPYLKPVLPECEIDKVRAIEGEGCMEPQGEPLVVFVIGERVKILAGPAGGYHSYVARFAGGRLVLMGEDIRCPVEITDLTNVVRCST